MESRKPGNRQWSLFVGTGIVIVVLVVGLNTISAILKDIIAGNSAGAPPQPATPIVVSERSELDVGFKIVSTECLDNRKVDFSIVDLLIRGGLLPYSLLVENSKSEVFGPYSFENYDQPVQLKVYGGDVFRAQVRSYDDKAWVGTIEIPEEDSIYCEYATIPTSLPTFTPTQTTTITPTSTLLILGFNPTATHDENNIGSASTPTNVVLSTPTNIVFPTSTNIFLPTPTNIVIPTPTNIVLPTPTNIVLPTPTNIVLPTSTPINPNPKECEDGIDNDGDNLIDFPADQECKKASDPQEDK